MVRGVADDRVVRDMQPVESRQEAAHLHVESRAAGVVVGQLAPSVVGEGIGNVCRQIDRRWIVALDGVRKLLVRPMRRPPRQEQCKRIVRPLLAMALHIANRQVRFDGRPPARVGDRSALVLVVGLIEIATADADRGQAVDPVPAFVGVRSLAKVEGASVSGAVAVLTQGSRQRRNLSPRPVLIVDHAMRQPNWPVRSMARY